MAQKPASENFNAFTGLINNPILDNLYKRTIDTTFNFARNVTFHLEPAKTLPTQNAANYNPFLGIGGQDPRLDQGQDTGNKGVQITPITVTYKAHIQHGPKELSDTEPFKINNNECMLTTVIESMDDIRKCIEADIDGQRFVLKEGPKRIGFGSVSYVMSLWTSKTGPAV